MRRYQKFWTVLITLSPVVITTFPANTFPNTLAAKVLGNIGINLVFCSFVLCSIFSLIRFIINPYSSSDLTIFFISPISSFEIINVVTPYTWFFWIAVSLADIAGGNQNGNKRLLPRGVSKFFINGKPVVINGLGKLIWKSPFLATSFCSSSFW